MRGLVVWVWTGLLLCGAPHAQQSASYELTEFTWNACGHPADGVVLGSASFTVKLDAVGQALSAPGPVSASWALDSGFVNAYAPPGEVQGLLFSPPSALTWNVEPTAIFYNLYRDDLGQLLNLQYGECEQSPVLGTVTSDGDVPAAGEGYAYLVTAVNRIDEEGTKGADSGGSTRGNPNPCP